MSITDHPGFNKAISECGLTAREAESICEAVRAVEKALPDSVRCGTGAAQDRPPSLPDLEQYRTAPAPLSAKYTDCAPPQTLRAPSENSTLDASLAHLTAGEILDLERHGVQS